MFALDFNRPPPQPKTLAEAQQIIDVLWGALGEALSRIEKLEEQLNTDSNNSSQPPSSDSPKSVPSGARNRAPNAPGVPNRAIPNTNAP